MAAHRTRASDSPWLSSSSSGARQRGRSGRCTWPSVSQRGRRRARAGSWRWNLKKGLKLYAKKRRVWQLASYAFSSAVSKKGAPSAGKFSIPTFGPIKFPQPPLLRTEGERATHNFPSPFQLWNFFHSRLSTSFLICGGTGEGRPLQFSHPNGGKARIGTGRRPLEVFEQCAKNRNKSLSYRYFRVVFLPSLSLRLSLNNWKIQKVYFLLVFSRLLCWEDESFSTIAFPMNGPPIWTGHKKRRLGISPSPKGIFLSIVKKVCSLTQPFFQSEKHPNIKNSKLKIVFCSIWNLGTCNRGSLPTQPTLDAAFCSAPQVGTVVNLNKERLGGMAGWICGRETGALMSKVFSPFFSFRGKIALGFGRFSSGVIHSPKTTGALRCFLCYFAAVARAKRTFLMPCVNDFSMLRSPTGTFALIKHHYFNVCRTHASMSSSSLSLLGGILTASPLVMTLMSHLR